MTIHLPLPADDSLTLTGEELADLTGAARRDLQLEWLRSNGWRFVTTRAGDPRVGRLYANLKLAGVELREGIAGAEPWEPNLAAIGGG
ncbi:MAG: DUF4224 domain-containing protein [Mitsuaria chitosanitabida]|uniref:DUF4224 domain-containing protein n=1 Tax=Roseateles chitosanitabidus TaxID=65048 RepID=UPI001B28202D|nr:DUF4224 domain-containing protein [Roseateles chitosanitabidus]MBO9685650.1 DUF4224 domain-containing protein [Roseateles chitosanitabidus]